MAGSGIVEMTSTHTGPERRPKPVALLEVTGHLNGNPLRPILPDARITTSMKHGEHDENITATAEEYAVGKPSGYRPTHIVSYQRANERRFGCPVNRCRHFAKKVFAESSSLLLVPGGGLKEFGLCGAPKYDAQGHFASRARIDALTSSHGTTSSGNASSSATRRSSSARCASVNGNFDASAQILAHISSTSAKRSSIPKRSIPKFLTDAVIFQSLRYLHSNTPDPPPRPHSQGTGNQSDRVRYWLWIPVARVA
jgi:hypothetical protein